MQQIEEYLSNPIKIGVCNSQFRIDFSGTTEFYRNLVEKTKKQEFETKEFVQTLEDLESGGLDGEQVVDKLSKGLYYLICLERGPKPVLSYLSSLSGHPLEKWLEFSYVSFKYRRLGVTRTSKILRDPRSLFNDEAIGGDVFKSHVLGDLSGVLWIDRKRIDGTNNWSFDVTTVKDESMERFLRFVKSIPHIGKTIKEIRKRWRSYSRYVFRPYPLAVVLWLQKPQTIDVVPKDLRDFLHGAVRNHSEKRWRTSIVLSAITLESILADLYEEKYQEPAPDISLGQLYNKVEKRTLFPSEIAEAKTMTNKARIRAVHRSLHPVSEVEATDALYGATKFTLWYFQKLRSIDGRRNADID